jgi:5'-3' exonuclease
MDVHLVDGTYELFRHFYGIPSDSRYTEGNELQAVRNVLASMLGLLEEGATHLGVATDHVIESFRNDLWPGYKTGAGIDPALLAQFHPLESALATMGVKVWPMVEVEADDALAAAAARAAADPRVQTVYICTPDKDLGQSVTGRKVVQVDRRRGEVRDEAGVKAKFGVGPASIPDYLALVGDTADGFPGLKGWGAKSAARVLSRYPHIELIPDHAHEWDVSVRGATGLATALAQNRRLALLFREIATLRLDVDVFSDVDELRWTGPEPGFEEMARSLRAPGLLGRATRLGAGRA